MTLIEKLLPKMYCFFGSGMLTNSYDETVAESNAKECEKIADDYAIEFVKFIETDKNIRYVGCVIENGEEKQYSYNRKYYTTEELVEIFKKEKGL